MSDASATRRALSARLVDRVLFGAGVAVILAAIVTCSRANVVADSVDYYAILQRLATPEETPIARNLHFVDQRSPGYPILALLPYVVLDSLVGRCAVTEEVNLPAGIRPPAPPGGAGASEPAIMPPVPLLLREVPFRDFSIPAEGSWYRWKCALALAVTSYAFLFAGVVAGVRALRSLWPSLPGYSLAVAIVLLSPIFAEAVVVRPLYATLTAYGLSGLFALSFVTGHASGSTKGLVAAGVFLGLLVLTRLETGALAVTLGLLLAFRSEWRVLALLAGSAAPAALIWVAYNLVMFGRPVALGMLRGDINRIALDLGYVTDSLIHPASGVIFWSPLVTLGVVGLLASRTVPLRLLGISSLALLVVCLVRVPIMYYGVPGDVIDIGGIPVTVPDSPRAMHQLIRGDVNRYVIVLAPFAVLGLRDGLRRIAESWRARRGRST